MATSEKQLSVITEERSMSLRADFPVNPSAPRGNDEEIGTTVTYGRRCLEQFARYVPDRSLRKMFAELLIAMPGWSSRRCKLTWKAKVTTFGRLYFLQQVSAPRTEENGSGLLPTVTSVDHNPPGRLRRTTIEGFRKGWSKDMSLSNYLTLGLLPTPTAREPGWRHLEIVDKSGEVPRHFQSAILQQKNRSAGTKGLVGPPGDGYVAHLLGYVRCKGRMHAFGSQTAERHLSLCHPWDFRDAWKDFPTEPPVCPGDDGFPGELDGITFPAWRRESIKAAGNAIVLQVAFQIFKAIALMEERLSKMS